MSKGKAAISIAIVICLALFSIYFGFIKRDEVRFKYFESSCKDANEIIYMRQHAKSVFFKISPWADVVEEDGYFPMELAMDLLTEPKIVPAMQVLIDVPRSKVVYEKCAGEFVFSVTEPKQVGVLNCIKNFAYKAPERAAPYTIRYEYGERNIFGIQPLSVVIVNTFTGAVVARQNTYILLLGNMQKQENRRWYGYGSAQGAKVCKLTPIKHFVEMALGGI